MDNKKIKFVLKLLLGISMFLGSVCTWAQAVYPLGKGVPNQVEAHCVYNGKLYVAYRTTNQVIKAPNNTRNVPYVISVWNGVFWTTINDSFTINFPLSGSQSIRVLTMAFFNGDIYIGGDFDSVLNVPNGRLIIEWNGKAWTGVGGMNLPGDNAYIKTMAVYKSELYIGGLIDTLPGVYANHIASWDGTKWNALGKSAHQGVSWSGKRDTGYIGQLLPYQDSLYVIGAFNRAGDTATSNLAVWDGSAWHGYSQGMYPFEITAIAFYDGEMYISGDGDPPAVLTTYKKNKTTGQWIDVHGLEQAYSFAVVGGRLWASGYAPGPIGFDYSCGVYDGKGWQFAGRPFDVGTDFGSLDTLGGKLYLLGSYYNDASAFGNINAGIVDTNIVEISGRVSQHSCYIVPPMPNPPLKGEVVEAEPGGYFANTDDSGNYVIFLNAGNYTVSCHKRKYWVQLCPTNPADYTFSDTRDTAHIGVDFSLDIKPDVKDLKINLIGLSGGYGAVRGATEWYRIAYRNVGTEDIASGTLYLRHPLGFKGFVASPSPDSYTAPLAKWSFANLKVGEQREIDFNIRIDSALKLKDTIRFYSGFDSVTNVNDSNLTDNFDTLTQVIVASHDPNSKQSYPFGDITSPTTGIRYMIHFQNTGSAPAQKVVVVDTLDTSLPLTDVVINSASSAYTLQIIKNVLIWTFDNINLPDSIADPIGSQGYISFSTGIRQGAGTGREIDNRAWVYFDYELPIGTNKTANTVAYQSISGFSTSETSMGFAIYPNPASKVLNIINLDNKAKTITLYNMIGQYIGKACLTPNGATGIDISKYAPGIYLAKSDQSSAQKVVIEQ